MALYGTDQVPLISSRVARFTGKADREAVKFDAEADLATEPGKRRKASSQIQHVLFFLQRGRQARIIGLRDDHMAGRAGEIAAAGPFDVDALPMGEFQQRHSLARLGGVTLASVSREESDTNHDARATASDPRMPPNAAIASIRR